MTDGRATDDRTEAGAGLSATNPTDDAFTEWLRDKRLPLIGERWSLPQIGGLMRAVFNAGVATHNTPSRERIAKTISRALGVTSSKNAIAYAPVNYLPAADAVLALLAPTGNEASE